MAKYSYETQAPPTKALEGSKLSMNSRLLFYSMAALVVTFMFWFFYA